MEETIFIVISIILCIALFTSKDNEEDVEINNDKFYFDEKPKEEQFYHPVTGYKGTKSEMDAYIINRENDMKK